MKFVMLLMTCPQKYMFPVKKDVSVKVFVMITRIYEAKKSVKNISFDCKCKFNSTKCNSYQKWNNDTCQCECKRYYACKKDYSWNPNTCICENSKCLKRIADESAIECNEIINVMDSVSTNVTNTIPTNVANTVSTNSGDKKVKYKIDCYILHTFLLVIILLFIIAIICYHYTKQRLKRKRAGALKI